jgi:hypothetical protein
MLPNKMTFKWDDNQVKMQIESHELAYKLACINKEFTKAMQLRIMIDQLKQELKDFQDMHCQAFAERYQFNTHIHIHVNNQSCQRL